MITFRWDGQPLSGLGNALHPKGVAHHSPGSARDAPPRARAARRAPRSLQGDYPSLRWATPGGVGNRVGPEAVVRLGRARRERNAPTEDPDITRSAGLSSPDAAVCAGQYGLLTPIAVGDRLKV